MIDIPSLLPSGWFSESYNSALDELIRDSVVESSDIFFAKLTSKTPTSAEIQIASDALRNKLIDIIESNYWIDTLCGEDATSDQRGYIRLHLRKLISPPTIPDLSHLQTEVRPLVLTIVSAITTALGLFVGGGISKLSGGVEEVGLTLGAIVGTVTGVFGVTFLASNETLRKRFLVGLGLISAADLAIFGLRNMSLITRGSLLSIGKRFIFYVGLSIIVFVSKRERVFNRENYRREVEAIIEQWFHAAIVVFTVLTYKINSLEQNPFNRYAQDKEKLNAIVSIVRKLKKLQTESNAELDSNSILSEMNIILAELVQELEAGGFEINDKTDNSNFCNDNSDLSAEKILIWDESQNKFYTPIGIIRNGDKFQIVEEPIIRNENIERKGIVRKKL
ncbi:MAG: hypothetical protein LBB88_02460 [Planctomycetaceae bacterium]|jgi:hypothetical protein|nr:hypothetical protein [Planctomycetaceae bacterium]